MGSGFAIGYGTALLMRPRVYYVQRPHNYQEIVKEKPLRCATTNTSVIFSKADYEGQDIDVKEDEVQCQVLHHHPIGSLSESTKCPNALEGTNYGQIHCRFFSLQDHPQMTSTKFCPFLNPLSLLVYF